MKRPLLFFFLFQLGLVLAFAQSVRLNNSEDWWSISGNDPRRPKVKSGKDELPKSNFTVAGVALGDGGFEAITAKLGSATVVERGDGASGRSQICYASAKDSSVFLAFEFGEDESLFYLFRGAHPWSGRKYCAPSKLVSNELSTASGLKLGLTRKEVEAILGQPDASTENELVYSRGFEKRSTPKEFETFRKEYPDQLSDEEAHKRFDFYPVEQYVFARFSQSKLDYLAVSTSGTTD
jgi:hypothetical protein